MEIGFTVSLAPSFAELTCRGTYSTGAMLDVVEEALEVATREGKRAVLIDTRELREEVPLSTLDRYQLGSSIASRQLSRDVRVTIAILGKAPLIEPGRFGEVVAVNRGASGKAFTDRGEAVAWLERREFE